ncbi:hypothetical protein CCR75_009479 [Bremia lactucae]|uniref:RxLR effector protein n=1 Tax=Bremia lactucae TaxID=4779 RepID=A0A976FLX9_BRELC|nr:hypothetical protein CCR75_009479 [Bremia lactucae]
MRVYHFALLAAAISITNTLASTADELTTHNEGTNFVTRLRVPSDKSIANNDEERVLSRLKGFLQEMGSANTPSHSFKNAYVALPGKNDDVATKTLEKWVNSNSENVIPTSANLMSALQLSDIDLAKALITAKFSNKLDKEFLSLLQREFVKEIVKKQNPNDPVAQLLKESFPKIYRNALNQHQKS